MADETEGTQPEGATEEVAERTFSQEEVNRLVGQARMKARAQFADYDDLKAKVESMGDYDEVKSELEALRAEKERAEEDRRAAQERADEVSKAAEQYGVDADMLARMSGDVEDNAKYLASRPKYAPAHDGGEQPERRTPLTAEQILAIKDPRQRRAAIADNIELFDTSKE